KAGGMLTLHGCTSLAELEALATSGAKTPDGTDALTTLRTVRGYAESKPHDTGRWPANVLLDHHAAAWVDEQSGISVSKASESRGLRGGILRLDGCRTVDELRALAEAGEKTPTG